LVGQVTVAGIVLAALSIAGVLTYAIIQVPSIRQVYGEYNIEDEYLNNMLYYVEIVLVVIFSLTGVLANTLLIIGAQQHKRWFLLHWLIFYGLIFILLVLMSVLIFVFNYQLQKLLGLISIFLAIALLLVWKKVFYLFGVLQNKVKPCFDPRCYPAVSPTEEVFRGVDLGLGYEFYPVDPVSRGLQHSLQQFYHPEAEKPQHYEEHLLHSTNNWRLGRFFRFYDTRNLDSSGSDEKDVDSREQFSEDISSDRRTCSTIF